MSESMARKPSRERYEFTWSSSGMHSAHSVTESTVLVDPDGHGQEPPTTEASADIDVGTPEMIDRMTNEPKEEQDEGYQPIDERSLVTFRSSPKSRGRLLPASGPLPRWARIAALAGWSCVAFAGAALILGSSGLVFSLRLAELGGVWGAVSAILWFVPGRLAR